MIKQIQPFFENALRIIIPQSPSEEHQKWFHELEAQSFRESLRYDRKELEERLEQDNLLFLFIVANDNPEGVILGYQVTREKGKTFYFDTFAVRRKGKGIGRIVLNHIIEWAKASDYDVIELDTEAENEVGIPLQKFYESVGFVVERIEDDGNITMSLTL